MGWTDADATELEQQALRLCMAFKNSLSCGWSEWYPRNPKQREKDFIEAAWIQVASICNTEQGLWRCSPDVLYGVYLSLAGKLCPNVDWSKLSEVDRRAWLRVSMLAKEIWREQQIKDKKDED